MKKIKSDTIGSMIEDVFEMEDPVLAEELNTIPGLELLLAASIMSCETDIYELISFAKSIDSETDFVCALADGDSGADSKFLLREVKDHLRAKYPSITSYLEDIYGCESESVSAKVDSLFD